MREDTKEYKIYEASPFGYNVRRELKRGGHDWMGHYRGTCSAGEFDFEHSWFLTRWGAKRAIKRDRGPKTAKEVETVK